MRIPMMVRVAGVPLKGTIKSKLEEEGGQADVEDIIVSTFFDAQGDFSSNLVNAVLHHMLKNVPLDCKTSVLPNLVVSGL
jgi:hypothetical protein